jgi:peptidoglycan hydrolase-like protein with peptidoglycan-binding domain
MKFVTGLAFSLLLANTGFCYAQTGSFSNSPSIDCSRARSAVASVLCNVPEAARADWEVNSATWALYFSVGEPGQRQLDADAQAWRQSLERICTLPYLPTEQEKAAREMGRMFGQIILGPGLRIPGPQPITQAHISCLIDAYRARAAMLRSRLKGDAIIEASLTPDQHAEIQEALATKGFLRVDQVGPGTHDGEFGPITRNAIKAFQQSMGATPNGFLTNDQRSALLETPGQREARDAQLAAQAAAEAKAKQDAQIQAAAQAAAEAKAKQDAQIQAAAEEKAKQDAENARLQAEAEAAKAWRLKVEEAQTKGSQYAEKADFKWSLTEADNPMTDDKDYTVTSQQFNGKGVVATIEGTCEHPGHVAFVATLEDAQDLKSPLGLPDFQNGYIAGNKRINDAPLFPTRFPMQKFRNSILISALTSLSGPEAIETTWRVLAEIETARGRIILQIPMFNPNVQKLLVACARQYENAKIRGGLADARPAQQ